MRRRARTPARRRLICSLRPACRFARRRETAPHQAGRQEAQAVFVQVGDLQKILQNEVAVQLEEHHQVCKHQQAVDERVGAEEAEGGGRNARPAAQKGQAGEKKIGTDAGEQALHAVGAAGQQPGKLMSV